MSFSQELQGAETLSDIFEVIKEVVKKILGRERSGLMLGLAELGVGEGGFVGAFYPVGSNLIVVNRSVLKLIEVVRPNILKLYCFGVLLHEYLHTLGILNEREVDQVSYAICVKAFGKNSRVSKTVGNIRGVMSMLVSVTNKPLYHLLDFINGERMYSQRDPNSMKIEILNDFDRSSTSYIG